MFSSFLPRRLLLPASLVARRRTTLGLLALAATIAAPMRAQTPTIGSVVTLRMLLDSVRASHPLVAAADARVRAARGSRTTAGTLGNPVLSYQVDNTPFPGGGATAGLDREAMTTATLPLEPLYQRGPRVARANADIRAAEADAVVTRQRVALEATRAYYRVALAQEMVVTTRDLSAWLDTVVIYNQSRVKEGVTSEADLIRSQLERDRADADATMAEAELALARAELASFIGAPRTDQRIAVAATDAPLAMPPALPASVTRGEVRAARERLRSATAGIATEQRMLIRQAGATIGTKQTMGTTSMIAGISLPIPLFDANRGEVQRASAERDAAAFELANAERVTSAELLGAREAARLLTDRAALLARRGPDSFLARAELARRIALGAYREGGVPLFQVIDAARTWGDARSSYFRALYAQHQSVIALLAAQGDEILTSPMIATPSEPAR
jgi:cobalt-zinc-cadmium efflux system outer membrane protein